MRRLWTRRQELTILSPVTRGREKPVCSCLNKSKSSTVPSSIGGPQLHARQKGCHMQDCQAGNGSLTCCLLASCVKCGCLVERDFNDLLQALRAEVKGLYSFTVLKSRSTLVRKGLAQSQHRGWRGQDMDPTGLAPAPALSSWLCHLHQTAAVLAFPLGQGGQCAARPP